MQILHELVDPREDLRERYAKNGSKFRDAARVKTPKWLTGQQFLQHREQIGQPWVQEWAPPRLICAVLLGHAPRQGEDLFRRKQWYRLTRSGQGTVTNERTWSSESEESWGVIFPGALEGLLCFMGDLGKPDEVQRINFTFHRFHDEKLAAQCRG
jgi:hypothetical protein